MKFFFAAILLTVSLAHAAELKPDPAADRAYSELQKLMQAPTPPDSWRSKAPSQEDRDAFMKQVGERATTAAEKAKEFYTQFPDHPRAGEVKSRETTLRQVAARYTGSATADDQNSFEVRMRMVQARAMKKRGEGQEAFLAELEAGARELKKDFPKEAGVYELLLMAASAMEESKARKTLQEIVDTADAPEPVRDRAAGMLKKFELLGKPVALAFTGVDGKKVDIAELKGKVVLIDFWATWCGPCIVELPNVIKTYEKLHPQGFEIIGISFDNDEEKLKSFLAREKMPWPQFYDGKGWQNKYGREFGINSIPSMWLVDKKGVLRDLNARDKLESKVAGLLAE